jgi:hypothetical protein
LTTLGKLLGADAFKPTQQGRADSVWLFDELWWLTIEAKSDASADNSVSMDDVRQANTHLRSLSADQGVSIPKGSISVIVGPKQLVHPDAVGIAEPYLFLASPTEVSALARDAIDAWAEIRQSGHGLTSDELVSVAQRHFRERRLLPSLLHERLGSRPIVG